MHIIVQALTESVSKGVLPNPVRGTTLLNIPGRTSNLYHLLSTKPVIHTSFCNVIVSPKMVHYTAGAFTRVWDLIEIYSGCTNQMPAA